MDWVYKFRDQLIKCKFMSAIGIDLGSLVSVIAVVQKGGVEIIANEASYRETSNSSEKWLRPR
jgi:molecular chaperone DnaK (HSP70)